MHIHEADEREYIKLRELWCEVFGDSPAFVDMFYDTLDAKAYVLTEDDDVKSCLTLFKAGSYMGKAVMVSYAICTAPAARGKGYASALVSHIRELVLDEGKLSLICPANEGLVSFYKRLGYKPHFYADSFEAEIDEDISVSVETINTEEYKGYREAFLADIPHIAINKKVLDLCKEDSVNSHGILNINRGDAICIIEEINADEMFISELLINPRLSSLSSEIHQQIAGAISQLFEVSSCKFRTISATSFIDNNGAHISDESYVQGMLAGADISEGAAAYYGFPID